MNMTTKILVNRTALGRAIANVRRVPMTDEQRRAMFARMHRGGGVAGSAPGTPASTYQYKADKEPASVSLPYPPGVRRPLTPERAATHAATLRGDIEKLLNQNQNMLEIGERENLQYLLDTLNSAASPEAVFTDAQNWKAFTTYVTRHILDAHREPTPGREPFVQFMYHIAGIADELGQPLPYNWYSMAGGSGRAPSASRVFDGPLMVPAPGAYSGGTVRRPPAVVPPPAKNKPPPGRIVLPIDRPDGPVRTTR
jgi:hypothetical protein